LLSGSSPLRRPDFVPEAGAPQGQFGDLPAGCAEVDTRGGGGLGEKTGPRHAGKRVRLKTKGRAISGEPKIYPGKIPKLQRAVRGERQLLHPASRLYRQVRRENFAAHPWGVLAFVVKDVVAEDDLANRQRPVG